MAAGPSSSLAGTRTHTQSVPGRRQAGQQETRTMAKKNWKVTGVFSDGDVEVYQFYYTQSAIEVATDLQESGASVSIERI